MPRRSLVYKRTSVNRVCFEKKELTELHADMRDIVRVYNEFITNDDINRIMSIRGDGVITDPIPECPDVSLRFSGPEWVDFVQAFRASFGDIPAIFNAKVDEIVYTHLSDAQRAYYAARTSSASDPATSSTPSKCMERRYRALVGAITSI